MADTPLLLKTSEVLTAVAGGLLSDVGMGDTSYGTSTHSCS